MTNKYLVKLLKRDVRQSTSTYLYVSTVVLDLQRIKIASAYNIKGSLLIIITCVTHTITGNS